MKHGTGEHNNSKMADNPILKLARVRWRQNWQVVGLLACLALTALLFNQIRHKTGAFVTVPDNVSVDEVIRGKLNDVPGPLSFLPSSCRIQHDLVFLGCPHCAPGLLDMVFCRHAHLNNLSVVLPVWNQTYSYWPLLMTVQNTKLFSPSFSNTSNRQLMNQNRLAMIRHPLDVLVSVFRRLRMEDIDSQFVSSIWTFLKRIRLHSSPCKKRLTADKKPCIFHVHNLLSQCMGMPQYFLRNRNRPLDAVKDYILKLDSELLLVMLREHLDESLVLLKRVMCWDFKDILYLDRGNDNARSGVLRALTSDDLRLHRRLNTVDYLMYEHFNATFWSKVAEHGEEFKEDLLFFRYLRQKVVWFCRNVIPYGEAYLQLPETKVAPAFRVSSRDCQLMNAHLQDMLKEWH